VADGVHQVRLAQAGATVQEQRVEAAARIVGDGERRARGEVVARTADEGVEDVAAGEGGWREGGEVPRVQSGAACAEARRSTRQSGAHCGGRTLRLLRGPSPAIRAAVVVVGQLGGRPHLDLDLAGLMAARGQLAQDDVAEVVHEPVLVELGRRAEEYGAASHLTQLEGPEPHLVGLLAEAGLESLQCFVPDIAHGPPSTAKTQAVDILKVSGIVTLFAVNRRSFHSCGGHRGGTSAVRATRERGFVLGVDGEQREMRSSCSSFAVAHGEGRCSGGCRGRSSTGIARIPSCRDHGGFSERVIGAS
jgi:hypothetical protein